MKFGATELALPGCFSATLPAIKDARGDFQKLFHAKIYDDYLPGYLPREIYLTTSNKGVLRGMHFQLPPDDHGKVVICLSGRVTDVLLDLRQGPGYGASTSVELIPGGTNAVLIPKGIAHGFYAHEDDSVLLYLVGTEYAPVNDQGVLWNSFGYNWPSKDVLLSERDTKHATLSAFESPVDWRHGAGD